MDKLLFKGSKLVNVYPADTAIEFHKDHITVDDVNIWDINSGSGFVIEQTAPTDWQQREYFYNGQSVIAGDLKADIALRNAQQQKLKQFKDLRDDEIFAPYNNVQVSNSRSREDVKEAIEEWDTTLGSPTSITWTMADDTDQDLTKVDLEAVKDGFVARKMSTFAKYQQLKAQVESAGTVEEVNNITW